METLILLGLLTYLAASINFSILLFRILGKGDPRDQFSGNAGTTNVSRQLGKVWGLFILVLDMGRACLIAQIGNWFLPRTLVPFLGLALVLGNEKPIFHGFRGGKGVASYLGFSVLISPVSVGISCIAWSTAYGLFRQPFIGSFFMVAVLGFGALILYSWDWKAVIATVLTMSLIFQAHKSNIIAFKKNK